MRHQANLAIHPILKKGLQKEIVFVVLNGCLFILCNQTVKDHVTCCRRHEAAQLVTKILYIYHMGHLQG